MHGANAVFALLELAILNAGLLIFFAMSFFKPSAHRSWRERGPAGGFFTFLFTEMYGVPLGLYFLAGWLQPRLPGIDWLAGRIAALLRAIGAPWLELHVGPVHWVGAALAGSGLLLVLASWRRLHAAARRGGFPCEGPYRFVRHPLIGGLVLVMTAVLFECPTLVNAVMYPALLLMYRRSAREEEQLALAAFGGAYSRYRARVPAFLPRLSGLSVARLRERQE